MLAWLDTILQGLMLGGLYALFATGLSLTFGVMRLVNIAHGDFSILAAYIALVLVKSLGLGPFAALILVVPIMGVIGYVLQTTLLNQTLGPDILPPLLVTFGLSIILQNGLMEVFSADSQGLSIGALQTESIALGGGLAVGAFPLLTLIVAVVVLGGMSWLFHSTKLGRALRATSDDQTTAQLMGIENRKIYGIAMALAMGLVAIAGVFLAIRTTFDPSAGPARLLYAFEAVIIGGLGSLWGTLAGGLVLGVAQTIGFALSPAWGIAFGHIAFLLVLLFRPNGLFPKTRDA
jgi:branched-chain amino acid transport system permease protein